MELSSQIRTALMEASLSVDDIDLLLLVGGSTKIPLVPKFVEKEIGILPKTLVDPDLAVVKGAAIQAGIIDGIFGEGGIVITDVCPYTLSIEALCDTPFGPKLICSPLIEKNTTIPVKKDKIFSTSYDRQTEAKICVYQGESLESDENIFLGEFMVTGIPPRKANKENIVVEFSYDLNGILVSRAKSVSSDTGAEIVIDMNSIERAEKGDLEIDISKWEQSKSAKKYKAIIKKAEKVLAKKESEELYDAVIVLKEALVDEADSKLLEIFKEEILEIIYDLEDE